MTAQSSEHRTTTIGGTGLLLIMATATIVAVGAITAFCVSGSWALLPVIMLVLLAMTAGVVSTLARLLNDGEVAAIVRAEEPDRAAQPVAAPRAGAAAAPSGPLLGH